MARVRTCTTLHPLLLLLLLVVAAGCGGGSSPDADGEPGVAVVSHLVDGDTIDVDLGGGRVERVRLIGIDTPETVDPDRPVGCHGHEASALTAALVPVGTPVRLERDTEARDRYGRLLAYVFRVDDGLFVNLALADAGEAELLEIEPNTHYADTLRAAVDHARVVGAGLWGDCQRPP